MVASISRDKWDLLGLPLGTPQADTVINKSLEQLNERRTGAAELNIGRNQIQRLDTVSESLKRMQREQVQGFTKVSDAIADANILSIAELMNIRDSVKDLTKTLKFAPAFQPSNRRSAAQRALDSVGDYGGPDRNNRGGRQNNRTTMQRTNRGNAPVRPPSVPTLNRRTSVPNFPLSPGGPQAPVPNGGGSFMDAVKYLGGALLTRLPAIAATTGAIAGISAIGDANRKNLEGVAPGEVHNYRKKQMAAANQAARDRILATREAVELNKPGNLDAAGNPTAEALNNITEKTREAAKEQLEELDGDIADLKRKSERGFLSKLGGWLGLTSAETPHGLPSGGGASAGAAVGAAIGQAVAGNRQGDVVSGGRIVGRYSGYTSQGSSVAGGAVAGTSSSVGDVGGMARAGSRVTGNVLNPNTKYEGGFVDPSTNPNVNKDVLAKYEGRNLPVVIRNNNPAALSLMKPGSNEFAERQEGYVGATARPANEGGYYAKYATPEHGIAANARLLENYGAKGVNTTDAIVRKWSTDAGAWEAYSSRLQKALGVKGGDVLDLNDKEVQRKILMAKSAHESGAGTPIYNEDTFKRGVNREFPQVPGAKTGTVLQPDGTTVPAGSSNVAMANQGKIRDMDIKDTLKTQLEYAAAQSGVKVEVTSGGQPLIGTSNRRTGSQRHDEGGAADLQLYRTDANGKKQYLDMNNPADAEIMKKFTADSVKAGATGVGAGYMGGKTLHIGGGTDATWGGAPWIADAHKAGVAGRAGFDVNKWAAARAAEAAPSAVSQTQKTYAEKMQEAGFTQKTPFGIRTPMGAPGAGVAGRAGFDVNKWAAARAAEAAPSAVSQTQKTYAEKMQEAGFTQKTPFGIRTPMGAPGAGGGDKPLSKEWSDYRNKFAEGSPQRAEIDKFIAGMSDSQRHGKPSMGDDGSLKSGGIGTMNPDSVKFSTNKTSFDASKESYWSKSYSERMGDINSEEGKINRQMEAHGKGMSPLSGSFRADELNRGGLGSAESVMGSFGKTTVTPGAVSTPTAFTAPEPAAPAPAAASGGGGGGGSTASSVSPSEIKTQPDDIGLNTMNTTDAF